MHKMFLIIHSKSPLPIPTEVKSDLFLVIKGDFFLPKVGVRMQLGVRKRGGGKGVLLARGRQSFRRKLGSSD